MEKWRLCWVYLDGSTLHIYKSYETADPHTSVELKEVEIFHQPPHPNRQFSLCLKTPEHHKWIACVTLLELQSWAQAITKAKAFPPSMVPPSRIISANQRTNTTFFRIKKSVAGRAATSKMGEVLLMKMFGEEIHHLLLSVRKIVTKHHDKQTADRVHKCLIRLVIKIAFLFEKQVLTLADVTEVDRPLREAIELLSKFYTSKMRRFISAKPYPAVETFARIETLARAAEEELIRKLQPYLTPKNLNNVKFLFQTIGTGAFLQKVWSDLELTEELDELDDLITAYTQFHL